jgi:hypothetical protein
LMPNIVHTRGMGMCLQCGRATRSAKHGAVNTAIS